MFQKASKKKARLRLALIGCAGSGKTYSALSIAKGLGSKIALIDSEHSSASKYAGIFTFDECSLEDFHPQRYMDAIRFASDNHYDVLVIDSLSHAWSGTGGILEQSNKLNSKGGNSFQNWGKLTPILNQLIETILGCNCHVIATMRSKMEYVLERDENTGKNVVKKVGMQPVMRDGVEFEFDLVGDMSEGTLTISKSRCPALAEKVIHHPNGNVSSQLRTWLDDGIISAPKVDYATREEKNSFYKECKALGIELDDNYMTALKGEIDRATFDTMKSEILSVTRTLNNVFNGEANE